MAWDVATGAKRTIFSEPDLSVDEFVLSRDGKTVYFTAESEGRKNLYEVPLRGGNAERAEEGGRHRLAAGPGRGFLVFAEIDSDVARGRLPSFTRRKIGVTRRGDASGEGA